MINLVKGTTPLVAIPMHVAEDLTSRFLNVINLFNGTIPLVAIQMQALRVNNDNVALVFTKVLDELSRGLVDEDEEVQEVADRGYWESRGSKATLTMVDQLMQIVHEVDPALELKYNKFYVGLAKDRQPHNFVVFRPPKNMLMLTLRLQPSPETQASLEASGVEVVDYDKREAGFLL